MHLLFVANFASDTGYAWETIERVFRRVGERLVRDGHTVTICYAAMDGPPPPRMRGAPFDFVAFAYDRVRTPGGLFRFLRLLRQRRVDALYLTDRETWSWRYPLFHLAGVRRILVHDRTSGERRERAAPVRWVKGGLHRVPWLAADCVVAVSDFVRRRLVRVNGTPSARTFRVYNGIDLAPFDGADAGGAGRLPPLSPGTRVVFCSGRAQEYKGFQTVVDAAALLRGRGVDDVAFVHCGDGPFLAALRARAGAAGVADRFHFLGRRDDVAALLAAAAVAVVPSLWAEAFGLTVVEAMAARVPVVASRVGGIPELVEPGRTGTLVPPGDAAALADAVAHLLARPDEAGAMAARAAQEVRRRFGIDRAALALYALVASQLEVPMPAAALHPVGAGREAT